MENKPGLWNTEELNQWREELRTLKQCREALSGTDLSLAYHAQHPHFENYVKGVVKKFGAECVNTVLGYTVRHYDYHSSQKSYYHELRKVSDELCRKYGLSVIRPGTNVPGARHYAEWQAEQNGKPTWCSAIKEDVDAAIAGSASFEQFVRQLRNEIVLKASGEGKTLEQCFTVNVELPDNIEFVTDLYDHEVDDPSFSFTAAIMGGTERAQLTVVANGATLTGKDSVYYCTLSRGNNLIRLKATDVDGKEYTQSYTIAYHKYIILEDENADETMPRITVNVADGMEITGSMFTMTVGAKNGKGERIYGDHLTVQLNGITIPDINEDTAKTYYRLDLVNGLNDIVITVWDYEDRYTIYRFTVNCTVLEEGAKKGTVTVSVEATTLGLGYLLPPVQMEIYEGENAVFPVAKALEAAGFEYQYSGSLKDGFYLAHLLKPGITNGWEIPTDLEATIDDDGLMWTNIYHTDSLGEFDFTQGSGWCYCVDNNYPNYGLSEYFPKDGEHIRLRFTLAYGRDVGNAADGSDNYDQQW